MDEFGELTAEQLTAAGGRVSGAPPENTPHVWLDEWPRIVWDLPLDQIKPAAYNPRFLSDEAFDRLKSSISAFGVIKPIIVNGSGTILAGHQRTKAMEAVGIPTTPAVLLPRNVASDDEVSFNLQHNSLENDDALVRVPPREALGYHWVHPRDIKVMATGKSAARVGRMGKLLAKHGPWGSAVADADGRIIANQEYASACKRQRFPLLVHYSGAQAGQVEAVLAADFGIYDGGKSALTPYVQTLLQRYRLRNIAEDKDWRDRQQGSFRSTTWENFVLPWLQRSHRVLDFGAGRLDYARHLQADGYAVWAYEPFFIAVDEQTRQQTVAGRRAFDLAGIGRMILELERTVRRDGLFDVVMLDSVINATSSEQYQDWIFNTVASFLKPDGRLVMGTLSTRDFLSRNNAEKGVSQRTTIAYMGKDNRAVAYGHGVLYAVKYHDQQTLRAALSPYFGAIEITGSGNQLHATCAAPRLRNRAGTFAALVEEFDMLYPDGRRHGAHKGLITAVMQAHWPDWAAPQDWPVGGLPHAEVTGDNQ